MIPSHVIQNAIVMLEPGEQQARALVQALDEFRAELRQRAQDDIDQRIEQRMDADVEDKPRPARRRLNGDEAAVN